MKTPNEKIVTLHLNEWEVDHLLEATIVLERATDAEKWPRFCERILAAYRKAVGVRKRTTELNLNKFELCELIQGVTAIERATGDEKWKILRGDLLQWLYYCEDEENEKLRAQTDSKYISYRIYEAPAAPTEKGKYIARTPLLPQALRACEMAKERGKSWFIKGITPDGVEVLLL